MHDDGVFIIGKAIIAVKILKIKLKIFHKICKLKRIEEQKM